MSQPNIILTGFMGTGKSSVGRLLAEKTGRLFIDTDEIIVDQTGVTISELFSIKGEGRFRELERQISRDLEKVENAVIATGGRLMLDPINALLLSGKNLIFCLTAAPEEILVRLRDEGGRPLLAGVDPEKRISQLLKAREEGYEQFRQVVTSGKSPAQVASEIIKRANEMVLEGSGQQILTSKLVIRHPNGQYPIFVGDDLLPTMSHRLSLDSSFVVITDDNVGPLYSHLIGVSEPLRIITMPSGEGYKNLDTLTPIYSQLLDSGLDRSGAIVALGGGVVGDMAGFLAATYMRGVQLIQCPTTLLSMVDASVGGKTGVDLAQGKNLVGAFKQPAVVLADLTTLGTLPENEFLSGMAEVIKHGIIASPDLLERIRSGSWKTYGVNSDNQFQAMIVEAINIKKEIVQVDPFEHGIRAHLNLGHTFAHAIETVTHYRIKHGFAVSMGLVTAVYLSAELGHCDPAFATTIERLLDDIGLPTRIPANIEPDLLLEAMQRDKKRVSGRIHYVLIRAAGDVFVTSDVPKQAVLDTIIRLQKSENKYT